MTVTLPTHTAALVVEYDGAPYSGWARQPHHTSVEGVLRQGFLDLSLTVFEMQCAGRTDAGVHATTQVVSVVYSGPIAPDRLARALDSVLPKSVTVRRSVIANEGFNARADASWRSYQYRVLARRPGSPTRNAHTLHHPRLLDHDVLHQAAEAVLGKNDFTAFTPAETKHTFFHRTVYVSRWVERGDELVYEVAANAFLRHMVRTIVGNMLAVGRGDFELGRLKELLGGGLRADARATAPPHGLCLVGVGYENAPDRLLEGIEMPVVVG
jgi:tRNA pseudouridine38-40 synthase